MKPRRLVLFVVTAAIALSADLSTKWMVDATLNQGDPPVAVVPGFFQIKLVHNTGAVASLLSGKRVLLVVVTMIAMAFIVYLLARGHHSGRWWTVSLGLLFGGAAGNLYDRLRYGYVRDFLDVYARGWHYPTFNAADVALVAGAIMLLVFLWRHREAGAVRR